MYDHGDEENVDEAEEDDVWDNMIVINSNSKSSKRKSKQEPQPVKKKKSKTKIP